MEEQSQCQIIGKFLTQNPSRLNHPTNNTILAPVTKGNYKRGFFPPAQRVPTHFTLLDSSGQHGQSPMNDQQRSIHLNGAAKLGKPVAIGVYLWLSAMNYFQANPRSFFTIH